MKLDSWRDPKTGSLRVTGDGLEVVIDASGLVSVKQAHREIEIPLSGKIRVKSKNQKGERP